MSQPRRIAIAIQIDEPYPHHQEVYAGILRYARGQANWRCLIDEHPGYDLRRRGVRAVSYDGVIARATAPLQRRLKRLGIPLVNTHYQTAKAGSPGVYVDPQLIGRLAAEHLIDRGFRRLGVLVDREHKHSAEIGQGFVRRADEAGIECKAEYFVERPYAEARYWLELETFLRKWLKTLALPIGLFIETSAMARLMVELCYAHDLHVPQEMAILCQHELTAVLNVAPQISSVANNYERVGFEAAALLNRLISGEQVPRKPILVPPRGIIARESTDYFAVEDEVVAAALRYVSSHLSEPLRVGEIAAAIAVSPRQLQQRFAAALGRGVSEEVRRLRLEAAKRMLVEPDRQIKSIANLTGFKSSDVMSQVFRRELGVTPGAYRKQVAGARFYSTNRIRTIPQDKPPPSG